MNVSALRLPRSPTTWALIVLLALEFFAFDHFGSHRVTGTYPRWNDQIQYLTESYVGYEFSKEHGIAAGLWHTLINPSAQGTLHDFAATILFQFTGASRSAALALNMMALMAWQLAVYAAIRRRTQSPTLAFLAALLPLALRGPWQVIPGSANDFRLDHFAMCALGLTSTAAILTEGMRNRGWAILFGACTGLTLLTRFITGTYLLVIFVAIATWCLCSDNRWRRLTNLILAALIAAAMAGPVFWLNREWVWNYYYLGHYVGPESAIRNQNFGVGRSLAFVWGALAQRHLGWFFGAFALGMMPLLVWLKILSGRGTDRSVAATGATSTTANRAPRLTDIVVLSVIFLLAPALVLTLHPQKSDVVVSALVPGVVLLVAALWGILRSPNVRPNAEPRQVARSICLVATVAVGTWFGQRQLAPAELPPVQADLQKVTELADYIFDRITEAKLTRPHLAVDHITDAWDARVMQVIYYERRHRWLDFEMTLPTGLLEPPATEVRDRLYASHFVFLTATDWPPGGFPYDQKLAAMRPELRNWCDTHLADVRHFIFFGRPLVLYQRREIPLR